MFDENINLYEDWELWIRIIKSGGKVKKIEDVLYFYQKHENQNSLIDHGESIENFDKSDSVYLYIYNKHYDFYKKMD